MSASEPIGTVEILRHRVYTTDSGDLSVSPGVYPIHRSEFGIYSFMLRGRLSKWVAPEMETLEPGMFMIRPGGDKPRGSELPCPYGHWTPKAFAELLADPVATEGHPDQRLRFRLEAASDAR
jgi:hypothetical protein